MKTRNIALITSAGGHGFMEANFAQAYGQKAVACSDKTTKEEFEKETADIYARLSPFIPDMEIATWEQAETLHQYGVSYRKKLLDKQVGSSMWYDFANTTLSPTHQEDLPKYNSLGAKTFNVMLIPQKLVSDNLCGVSAKQQSVPLDVFNFFMYEKDNQYILGQHFHNKNDIELVNNIAKDFSMYVPGEKEDKEVFGIRGVPHNKYLPLYQKVDMAVGTAGTHTWYMLTCFPDIPQIILYNKNGTENWQDIVKPFQAKGKHIYAMGFDENTNWKKFSLEIKALYSKISRTMDKKRHKSYTLPPKSNIRD